MKTLKLTPAAADSAFANADKAGKELLISLYPEYQFLKDITDRVKTFEDACKVLGIPVPNFVSDVNDPAAASIIAYKKLCVIIRALNEGWKPDWSDSSQYKYCPYFKSSGSGFAYNVYDYWLTYSNVGSRLCLKNSDLAVYAGKQFIEIYNQYLTM